MTKRARAARRWLTTPENLLWQAVRNRKLAGLKFRRKVPIDKFVVDFFCPSVGLIVEVEGKGHFRVLIEQRHSALLRMGYGVLYVPRERILARLDDVLREIEIASRCRA